MPTPLRRSGSFLRSFIFGQIRQLNAVASWLLHALAGLAGLFSAVEDIKGTKARQYALLDVDDTVIEVHGYAKQGAGSGYTRVRGIKALLATLSTTSSAQVVVARK